MPMFWGQDPPERVPPSPWPARWRAARNVWRLLRGDTASVQRDRLWEALDLISRGGSYHTEPHCATYTTGPGSCITNGRVRGLRYSSGSWCDNCIAWKALNP